MDSRVTLLKAFYGGLLSDKVKLETQEHGFAYVEQLTAQGAVLDYGELTGHGLLHKYKLSGVGESQMDALLAEHVAQQANVCLYFHPKENQIFSFNLDNNHKVGNTTPLAEMERAVAALRLLLQDTGIEPLVVASGRGYHLWGRLDQPVSNERLHAFMIRLAARTLHGLHQAGLDGNKVKFNFYPDPRSIDVVSLRLFGSRHAKTGAFSRIRVGTDGLLDEAASWDYFLQATARPPSSGDAVSG